ncbi:MAG TPA: hypothetical protein VGB73_07410 [Pyrinomonadaceae bacterium]|jgi:hypothetical protein
MFAQTALGSPLPGRARRLFRHPPARLAARQFETEACTTAARPLDIASRPHNQDAQVEKLKPQPATRSFNV